MLHIIGIRKAVKEGAVIENHVGKVCSFLCIEMCVNRQLSASV